MTKDRAVQALDRIVRQYPQGTALLFEGAGLGDLNYSGSNLAAALRRGDIKPGDLYDHTFGAYDDISGSSPIMGILNSKAQEFNEQNKSKEKTKFTDVLTGLLGAAGQAADIYGKFKNPGQQNQGGVSQEQQAGSKPPWILIAGAGILVILVIVLFVMRKK